MAKRIPCPVCSREMLQAYETCPVCNWCNDPASNNNPDVGDMPNNDMSLNEARAYYREKGEPIPYKGTYYAKGARRETI